MIFFKPKKLVVDLFTASPNAYEYAKPTLAKKWYPQWWKQLPKETPVGLATSFTMKRCYGMNELYQHGFIVPLWSDLVVEIGAVNEYRWVSAASDFTLLVHPQEQRGEYLPHCQHLKIGSTWKAKTNRDVPFMLFQPTWNYTDPDQIIIPPGIVPLHIHGELNVNMFVPRTDRLKTVKLFLGQPLIQLVPLQECALEVKTHLVGDEELKKLFPAPNSFAGVLPNVQKNKSGCPVQAGA